MTHIPPGVKTIDDLMRQQSTEVIVVPATIGGTGAQTVNVFEFTGSITIVDQWAEITRVGTLTNLTTMYADIWDGTAATLLTDNTPGASLSGAQVGAFFTKSASSSSAYTVHDATQADMFESGLFTRVGYPFTITAKAGVTNYIRFHYTTTDNPVDFDMKIYFEYILMDGGTLTLA